MCDLFSTHFDSGMTAISCFHCESSWHTFNSSVIHPKMDTIDVTKTLTWQIYSHGLIMRTILITLWALCYEINNYTIRTRKCFRMWQKFKITSSEISTILKSVPLSSEISKTNRFPNFRDLRLICKTIVSLAVHERKKKKKKERKTWKFLRRINQFSKVNILLSNSIYTSKSNKLMLILLLMVMLLS